jgi:hypothetical protein
MLVRTVMARMRGLGGAEILGRDMDDAVGIDIESNWPRHTCFRLYRVNLASLGRSV